MELNQKQIVEATGLLPQAREAFKENTRSLLSPRVVAAQVAGVLALREKNSLEACWLAAYMVYTEAMIITPLLTTQASK